MNCIYCENQLPSVGIFCPSCAKQVKCKSCKEDLLKDAKICVHCGEELGQKTAASNINTIEFSETETSRQFKATFTDTVSHGISDAFGIILANRVGSKAILKNVLPTGTRTTSLSDDNNTEFVEEETESNSELTQLKKIFKQDGDKITLSETRMKAKSKRDYSQRLALVFMYYKSVLGIDNVPRKDLSSIMENASVNDANFRYWVNHNPLIGVSGDTVEIKAPGKDKAKKIITEIFNEDAKDGWHIGTSSKVGRKPKDKKSADKK